MNTHLSEEEFTIAVEGRELVPDAAEHLAACIICRQQVAGLRKAVADRRAGLHAQAPDWERQRTEILTRLPSATPARTAGARGWIRPLLAVAAVLVMAVGLNSLWKSSPMPEPVVGSEIQIEEILAEVDAVLADDSLPGFEFIDPGMDDPASFFENGTS